MNFIDVPLYGNSTLEFHNNTYLPQNVITDNGLSNGQIVPGFYNVQFDPSSTYGFLVLNIIP